MCFQLDIPKYLKSQTAAALAQYAEAEGTADTSLYELPNQKIVLRDLLGEAISRNLKHLSLGLGACEISGNTNNIVEMNASD